MDKKSILKNLKLLGINKSSQLARNDISYWYVEMFKRNIKNEELLITINEAKEALDNLNKEQIIDILNSSLPKVTKSLDSNNWKNNPYSEYEKNIIPNLIVKYDELINDFDSINKKEKELYEKEKRRTKEKKIESNYEEQKNRLIINENKVFLTKKLKEAEKFFLKHDHLNAQKLYTSVIESSEFKYFFPISKRLKIYTQRGISFRILGQYEKALNDLTRAIEIDNNSLTLYFNRGLCNLRKRNWTSAIFDFSEAIVLCEYSNPEFPEYYYYRGLAKNGLKKYEDALIDFETATDMDPSKISYKDAKNFTLRRLSAKNVKKGINSKRKEKKSELNNKKVLESKPLVDEEGYEYKLPKELLNRYLNLNSIGNDDDISKIIEKKNEVFESNHNFKKELKRVEKKSEINNRLPFDSNNSHPNNKLKFRRNQIQNNILIKIKKIHHFFIYGKGYFLTALLIFAAVPLFFALLPVIIPIAIFIAILQDAKKMI